MTPQEQMTVQKVWGWAKWAIAGVMPWMNVDAPSKGTK